MKLIGLDKLRHPFRGAMAKDVAYLSVGQGLGAVFQAVYFIILAHLLGPAGYGLFAGVFALTSMFSMYSAVGMDVVLLRYVSSDRAVFAIYWGNALAVVGVVGGLMTGGLFLFGSHLVSPASTALIPFAAIANCICMQIDRESGKVYQAFQQMGLSAAMNTLTAFIRALVAVCLWLTLHHVTALQWAIAFMCASLLSSTIAIWNVTARFGWPQFTWKVFKEHAGEGFGYSFASSSGSLYNDLDKTMLSHYGMNVENGIYTAAYRVIDIATMPIYAIGSASLPKLFKAGISGGVAQTAGPSFRILLKGTVIALGLAVCIFLSAPLLPHIIGKKFEESQLALRWLSLIVVFRAGHVIMGNALTGAGLQRYRTASQMAAAGMNFLLNLWLIPSFGWQGAAWSSLATDAALALSNIFLVMLLSRRETTEFPRSR